MKNFFCILLICSKIIEIICVGENDAPGPSKKGNGKRKLGEYLEQNPSNHPNESADLVPNPHANWLQEGKLLPIGNDHSSKRLASTNDENIQNSLKKEQNQMQNIQPITIGTSSNPTENVEVIITNQQNFKDLVQKYTGYKAGADENEFKCNECGQTFANKLIWKQHEKEHYKSEKQFVCEKCGMRFNRNCHLIQHKGRIIPCIKKGSTPFQCTNCEKTFENETKLNQHIKRRKCTKKENMLESGDKGPMN